MRLLQLPDYWRAFRAAKRDPAWTTMVELFRFHRDRAAAIQRLARVWTRHHRLRPVDIYKGRIVEEVWPAGRVHTLVRQMAAFPHWSGKETTMLTSERPRFREFPIVVVRTQDREFLIDGRRRANDPRPGNEPFEVRVIEVSP